MKNLFSFLAAPALCACSPLAVIQAGHPTNVQQRSNAPASTVMGGSSGPVYNPFPPPAPKVFESPPNYNPLVTQAGKTTIKNSCTYPLHFSTDGCGGSNAKIIAPGETYTEATKACATGGVQLRIRKDLTDGFMLGEYTPDARANQIWYNLSFLQCMQPNSTHLEGCAGWEAGLQMASGKGCPVYACQPGEYCDLKGYTVPEYGYQPGPPVATCPLSEGIVMEMCAGNGKK